MDRSNGIIRVQVYDFLKGGGIVQQGKHRTHPKIDQLSFHYIFWNLDSILLPCMGVMLCKPHGLGWMLIWCTRTILENNPWFIVSVYKWRRKIPSYWNYYLQCALLHFWREACPWHSSAAQLPYSQYFPGWWILISWSGVRL